MRLGCLVGLRHPPLWIADQVRNDGAQGATVRHTGFKAVSTGRGVYQSE